MTKPEPGNIVNPARLSGRLRDSVCEQCHLSGEARVLNPGRGWQDFRPGAPLEDTFTVYIRDGVPSAALSVVSHAGQMAASRCFQESRNRLWCGSCHQVHASAPVDQRQSCLNCHPVLKSHPPERGDCTGCHMPKRPTADGGHTAFTDHRIARKPPTESRGLNQVPPGLKPWRVSQHDARNLGLAYLSAGDRWASAALTQSGFALLAARQQEFSNDPEVLGALGYVLMRKQRPAEAVQLLAAAVSKAPRLVRLRLNLALALAAAGKTEAARRALRELLELDPSVDAARLALVQLDQGR